MSSSCERCADIALAEAEGKLLANSDLSFRQQHESSCPACRAELAALVLLRMAPSAPAHFKASAAERARTIDAVLAGVDAPDASVEESKAEPEAERVVPMRRRARKVALWASGLVAAAAALALVVRGPVSSHTGPAPIARVLLASGGGLSAGATAAEGQQLSATDGETSLSLGSDIVILLDAGSKARIAKLSSSGIELALETGRVHASVKPHTTGPKLAVTTGDGRVEVTGTLFSVEAKEGASELRVLRGSVKVSAPGHAASRVEAMQAQRLGADEIRALSAPEQEGELAAMRRISLLEPAEAATLQVRSRPEGAKVTLDGEPIGATPLSAEVKSGHRHLVVASADRTAEEWVDLYSGSGATIRDYDLNVAVAVAEPVAEPDKVMLHRGSGGPKAALQEMLTRAEVLRSRREWAGSATAYKELLGAYPNASATEAAWITYGELLVDHLGDPKGALKACQGYLDRSPGGVNAYEACACRIRALRGLGRKVDERAAVQEFLERFPGTALAPKMSARLEELR